MVAKVKHTSNSGMKRKLDVISGEQVDKIDPSSKTKQPLKAELAIKLKELQINYEELEVKSKKDIEILVKENDDLKRKIKDLEAKNKKLSKIQTENIKCFNCNYETNDNVALKMHIFDKHVWPKGNEEAEDLELSLGPRFCRKCDYQAEDGYDLDAHFWGEHDDAENETIYCKFCDEIFVSLHDLMKHKKTNHREKVSLCDNFSNGSCIYGDENCWFLHENETEKIKEFKCNFCKKEFYKTSDFLKHRKIEHEQLVPACNRFKDGKCIFGADKCWFQHKKDESDDDYDQVKNNNFENNEVIQKIFKMMETMTQRILNIENN